MFFLLILVVWGGYYMSTLTDVFREWYGVGPYSHGLLALGIAGFFFWQERRNLLSTSGARFPGIICLVIASTAWWLADVANIFLIQVLSAFVVLNGAICALVGWGNYRQLWFPILVVFLVLPIWNVLQLPLRDISTVISYQFVDIIGIPVIRDGYVITTPGGKFIVEEACSGLSFFMVAILLGVCFGKLNQLKIKASLGFILFSICLAIFANWVRIIVIIIVGSYTNMQHPIVTDHITFGWFAYVVTLIPLIWVGRRFFLRGEEQLEKREVKVRTGGELKLPILLTALCALSVIPIASSLTSEVVDENYGYKLPGSIVKASSQHGISWYPTYSGSATQYKARYIYKGKEVFLFIANYPTQEQGAELIHVENELFRKLRWHPINKQSIGPDEASFIPDLQHLKLKRSEGRYRDIGYWYIVGGKVTANAKLAKAYEILASVTGNQGSSIVAIATDSRSANDNKSLELIKSFASDVYRNL